MTVWEGPRGLSCALSASVPLREGRTDEPSHRQHDDVHDPDHRPASTTTRSTRDTQMAASRPSRMLAPPVTAVPVAGPDRLVVLTTGALVVTTGVLVVAGLLAAIGAPAPSSLGDPGPLTTTGLPLARYLQDILGTLVVGCALLPVLQPGAGPGGHPGEGRSHVSRRAHGLLAPFAGGWLAATAAVYVLVASDLSGRPVPEILTPEVQQLYLTLPQARAQLLVGLAAVVLAVAVTAGAGEDPWARRGLLAVATVGLLPPTFVGHAASAADHETAVASVSVHLVAGALWVGGLAVLAVLVLTDRRSPPRHAVALVRSYSTLALGCVVVVGASGVLSGALRIGPGELLTSAYGLLLLVKASGLAVLVGFGWWHRRRSISSMGGHHDTAAGDAGGASPDSSTPPVETTGRAAFVRLVVVELVVMAMTIAAAVVLARTPPPGLPGS